MNVTFVVNSRAGAAAEHVETIHAFASQNQRPCYVADFPGDVADLVQRAAADRPCRLVIAGGDGTVSGVVGTLAGEFEDLELAVVPIGTGNDLARSLDLPLLDVEASLSCAWKAEAVPIDVMRVTNGSDDWAINAVTGGFGGEVTAAIAGEKKRVWGAMAYWIEGLHNVMHVHDYRLHLEIDGMTLERAVSGITVANGRTVGGGFPIAPWAMLDDGLLDVTLVPIVPTLEMLAVGLDMVLGREHPPDQVMTHRAKRIHLDATPPMQFSIDGESQERFEATLEVLPRALRVVAGPHAALVGNESSRADQAEK